MTDFARAVFFKPEPSSFAAASCRSRLASESPHNPRPPTCKKSRRDWPLQSRERSDEKAMSSMMVLRKR